MAKKGALAKDPKKTTTPSAPTRPENKAIFDAMTPEQQARYTRVRANKGLEAANKYVQSVTGKQMTGPGGRARTPEDVQGQQPVQPPTPQQLAEEGFRGSADLFGQMQERFQQFDPMQAQAQYNPVFSQEMERARQNIMGQFDRRNAQQFAQERQLFETSMANRGIAPGGEQYNRELQALTDRQDRARQEAMSAAEQAAQGVQQQYYGQAMQTAQMPYDIYGSTFAPVYGAGVGQAYAQQTGQQAQEYAKELAALDNKYKLQQIRATPRGGGGGGGPSLYDRMEAANLAQGNQPQPQNPWANAAAGAATSFGAAFGAGLAKG